MSSYEDQLKYYADYCTNWTSNDYSGLIREEHYIKQVVRNGGSKLYAGRGLDYIERGLSYRSFLQSFLINDIPISYDAYGFNTLKINGFISEDHKRLISFDFGLKNPIRCQITNFIILNKFIIKNIWALNTNIHKNILSKNDTYYTYSFPAEMFKDI